MLNRLLSALAISTVVVGCCFAFSEGTVPASQSDAAGMPVTPEPAWVAPHNRIDTGAHMEMDALERRVRVGTILYTGRFGQQEWPPRPRMDAVALTLRAGTP